MKKLIFPFLKSYERKVVQNEIIHVGSYKATLGDEYFCYRTNLHTDSETLP